MTEYNKEKLRVLESIQEYMLKLETAKNYAEKALEHAVDEDYESAEFYMGLANSVGDDSQMASSAVPTKKEEKLN